MARRSPVNFRSSIKTVFGSDETTNEIARSIHGTQLGRPGPQPPVQSLDGRWMEQIILSLPTGMRESLEERATQDGSNVEMVIRAALVAAGFGHASDVESISDVAI